MWARSGCEFDKKDELSGRFATKRIFSRRYKRLGGKVHHYPNYDIVVPIRAIQRWLTLWKSVFPSLGKFDSSKNDQSVSQYFFGSRRVNVDHGKNSLRSTREYLFGSRPNRETYRKRIRFVGFYGSIGMGSLRVTRVLFEPLRKDHGGPGFLLIDARVHAWRGAPR